MAVGLIGKKRGMSRLFLEDGESVPVTVIEVVENSVTQIKTIESDGYTAIQIKQGLGRRKCLSKAMLGVYKKAGVEPGVSLHEFRVEDSAQYSVGQNLPVSIFSAGQLVDVTGVSKGKGFAGAVKRWNFRTQDATHGNSVSHRVLGSTGQNQSPGRVFPGKKMPGQLGNEKVTQQSLKVVRVDSDRGLLLLKGSVPGAIGGLVTIIPAVKSIDAA